MRRWVMRSVVVAGLLGLVLAGVVPHRHADGASDWQHAQACRVCRMQQAASAPPPSVVAVQERPPVVVLAASPAAESPRVAPLVASASPRSPPVLA